jgi:hypothetical protein
MKMRYIGAGNRRVNSQTDGIQVYSSRQVGMGEPGQCEKAKTFPTNCSRNGMAMDESGLRYITGSEEIPLKSSGG